MKQKCNHNNKEVSCNKELQLLNINFYIIIIMKSRMDTLGEDFYHIILNPYLDIQSVFHIM